MVLDLVYHWIIHLRWFYYFVRLARIKILNHFQFIEQMKTAADLMVGGCYFRHVGGKMWLFGGVVCQ